MPQPALTVFLIIAAIAIVVVLIAVIVIAPVSYTHLTLPTICSV